MSTLSAAPLSCTDNAHCVQHKTSASFSALLVDVLHLFMQTLASTPGLARRVCSPTCATPTRASCVSRRSAGSCAACRPAWAQALAQALSLTLTPQHCLGLFRPGPLTVPQPWLRPWQPPCRCPLGFVSAFQGAWWALQRLKRRRGLREHWRRRRERGRRSLQARRVPR